jgi:hypothetical protein
MLKSDIPKKLLRKMMEAKGGYYEFDTSAVGPFRLPLMGQFESADLYPDLGQIELRFRDHQDQKSYRIPLRARTLKNLVDSLTTIDKQYGDKLRIQDEKLSSGPSETQ